MVMARDIMHAGVECVPETETLDRAAQIMRDKQIGSLPICSSDDRLTGILTDRDIVVKCIAYGKDPAKVTAADLAQGTPVFVDASANEDEVLSLMQEHRIKRLPVMEGKQLIGMISEADLAQNLTDDKLADFVVTITAAPPTEASRPSRRK